jgi:hypothetical protein
MGGGGASGGSEEHAVGFAHVSNLVDGAGAGPEKGLSAAEVQKRYKVGGLVKGRVIGFRLIDALVAMSLKESVLAQQVGMTLCYRWGDVPWVGSSHQRPHCQYDCHLRVSHVHHMACMWNLCTCAPV